jgi:endonuclease/exonuclease/phosphatase (EEP) superfamily protein YafD
MTNVGYFELSCVCLSLFWLNAVFVGLDHIFTRNLNVSSAPELVDINDSKLPLSDHFGVLAQFEISK